MNLFKRKLREGRTLEGLIQVRGSQALTDSAVYTPTPLPPRELRRVWQPRGLERTMLAAHRSGGWSAGFHYDSQNRGAFYRWLRESIPIISAGIWAWVRLCSTPLRQEIEGSSSARAKASAVLTDLNRRILEAPYGKGSGLMRLTEAYFLELFTTGRFAGEIILDENEHSIDHFRFLDPYAVGWLNTEKGWTPFIERPEVNDAKYKAERNLDKLQRNYTANKVKQDEISSASNKSDDYIRLDPQYFFYGTLGTDLANPLGNEPLACIPFVSEIEQLMLEDMARSSHNAGTPRLQVKIGRPERFSWEGDKEYVERSNRFFQDMVTQFGTLEPDDNVFTWNDVEVVVVGGSGKSWEWRLNREQVVEDVVTGLKLFPWVLGRTHKTTQNWVQSQYDLLMQVVQSHQKTGSDLADWITNSELKLRGIEAVVRHKFDRHPDPFRLERAQAERSEFDRIDLMVQRGYVTQEEAKQMLGL
ncbi:MAG: hypothetical protein FJY65_10590 [Calditrichaeota bacterium]|nr:hypothetical protein [Calditrichota bacterium]